ncbi:MAG: hypothetical protein KDD67_01310 [Ignavibacteriae bacterium]|nr:hypothetical protein [Ignavibacteriota bacterium]MCB9216543.1 hypothetical protein [Ignavibacteria bacterium]
MCQHHQYEGSSRRSLLFFCRISLPFLLLLICHSLAAQTFYREGYVIGGGPVFMLGGPYKPIAPSVEIEYIGKSEEPYTFYSGILFRLIRGEVTDQRVIYKDSINQDSWFIAPVTPYCIYSAEFTFRHWFSGEWQPGESGAFAPLRFGLSVMTGAQPNHVDAVDLEFLDREPPRGLGLSFGFGFGYEFAFNENDAIRLTATIPIQLELIGDHGLVPINAAQNASHDSPGAFAGFHLGLSYQHLKYYAVEDEGEIGE